ncbi:DUF2400 family protein [Aminiphilus circumscriptus]|uniref:DUF2400 family protein n=1 Tax=Aminiphilus circumscriptus TaxID=290732 RepID=UPI0004927B37|nr:DUF2400 family protein [Aminiphilus circumscriptus]
MLLPLRCRTCFDALYETYASPRYLDPDPVLFLHRYDTPEDVEVAGLLAACFAYGKVRQIQRSVEIPDFAGFETGSLANTGKCILGGHYTAPLFNSVKRGAVV